MKECCDTSCSCEEKKSKPNWLNRIVTVIIAALVIAVVVEMIMHS